MRSGHRHLHRRHHSLRSLLLSGAVTLAAPVVAAEVTPQRLASPEPQNWLMNHRTYDVIAQAPCGPHPQESAAN